MQFVGEHIAIGFAGKMLIWASFISLLLAAVFYLFSCSENQINFRTWRFRARHLFSLHFFSILGVFGILVYITLNHYFEYNHVWRHSAKDLSFGFLLSSIWAGQEGSFLLWIFFQGLIGIFLMYRTRDWEMPVMTVVSISQLFLTSTILGVHILGLKIGNNPFMLLREAPENVGSSFFSDPNYLQYITDGAGLNPLLLNVWMKAHPPVIFLGFASVIVPFAYAVAALWKKNYAEWLKPVIPWLSFATLILGAGILMGGAWAYQDLTFGGFWSWDPVENSSLVPWIILVASLHLVMISKINKQYLFPAFLLTILAYVFVLYSTFLTKSGLLSNTSAHAFGNTGLTWHLAVFLFAFFFIPILLLFSRVKMFPESRNEKVFSKEFWMFIGAVILMLSAFQIIFSTSVPLINRLIGTNISPPSNRIAYYNTWQLPFAAITGILIAFTQYLIYCFNEKKVFFTKLFFSFIISIILTTLLYFYSGISKPLYLIMAFACLFAAVSSIDILLRLYSTAKNKSSLISHLGLGIFLFGILLSLAQSEVISKNVLPAYRTGRPVNMGKSFNDAENMLLPKGEILPIYDYYVSYTGFKTEGNKVFYQLDFLKKGNDGNYYKKFTVYPAIIINSRMGNVYVPAIKHFIDRDIFTFITFAGKIGFSEDQEKYDVVIIKSMIFPFILVVWTGAIIMLSGFVLSIFKRSKNNAFIQETE